MVSVAGGLGKSKNWIEVNRWHNASSMLIPAPNRFFAGSVCFAELQSGRVSLVSLLPQHTRRRKTVVMGQHVRAPDVPSRTLPRNSQNTVFVRQYILRLANNLALPQVKRFKPLVIRRVSIPLP
jgi:hypothetical protein